jgi:hypothetical protein
LKIDDLGRDFDAFPKLTYMEDIMNGCWLRRKLKTISYRSTSFKNFKRSNIPRSEFSFDTKPLNTLGRRYP